MAASAETAVQTDASIRDDPGNWKIEADDDGKLYYVCVATEETTWEKPEALMNPREVWRTSEDDTGKTFYFHYKTKVMSSSDNKYCNFSKN